MFWRHNKRLLFLLTFLFYTYASKLNLLIVKSIYFSPHNRGKWVMKENDTINDIVTSNWKKDTVCWKISYFQALFFLSYTTTRKGNTCESLHFSDTSLLLEIQISFFLFFFLFLYKYIGKEAVECTLDLNLPSSWCSVFWRKYTCYWELRHHSNGMGGHSF